MDVTPLSEPYPFRLDIPSRFGFTPRNHKQAIAEIEQMAEILCKGAEALSGLYLRICDMIRRNNLTDDEIRQALSKRFPPPRVSEFIKVCNAEDEVYRRYRLGVVGFKAVLLECRGYKIHTTDELHKKKIRRAAERLILLLGQGEIEVCGRRITVA